MRKITLEMVITAINHCSDLQEKEIVDQFNSGKPSWAGIAIMETIENMYEEEEEAVGPPDADEWNRDADKAGIH